MLFQPKVATLRVEGSTQETYGACRGGNESMGTQAALGEESRSFWQTFCLAVEKAWTDHVQPQQGAGGCHVTAS